MDMDIRISVIMGVYNCAPTLAEALDSLLAQTYQGFKVIMCDDGSTDNTREVAQSYVERYPGQFILIRNERNMGLNYTLNHCLKYADTEYVARMDGDDISLPERFEKEMDFLDSNLDYALVSTAIIYFDGQQDFGHSGGGYSPTRYDLAKNCPFAHPTCMMRTEVIKSLGGYSDEPKLWREEDYHLWFKLYASGKKGYILPDMLLRFRDDRNATKRRTWLNRRNEAYVRWIGCRMLRLPLWMRIYSLRPLIVGMLPLWLYNILHKRRLR